MNKWWLIFAIHLWLFLWSVDTTNNIYKQVWPGVKCKYGPLVLLVTITEQTVDSAKAMAAEGISMIESPLGSGN